MESKPDLEPSTCEPRRPNVRRNEIRAVARFERDFEQMTRVETEDGATVGVEIAEAREPGDKAFRRREVGHVMQVMHFPRLVVLLVDRRNFDLQKKPRRLAGKRGNLFRAPAFQLRIQSKQSRLGGHEFVFDFCEPLRMREIAGAEDGDAFLRRPERHVFEVEVAARGAGELRMQMQIGVERHGTISSQRTDGVTNILRIGWQRRMRFTFGFLGQGRPANNRPGVARP